VIATDPGSGQHYPWWERYQTVSYSLANSRSGTLSDFQAMVTTCKNAGVGIYVDAVVNHMTAGSGTGSNGTNYTKYNYPGVYQFQDFHADSANTPEYCARSINGGAPDYDYTNNTNDAVRRCELVGLADLNTSSDYVRQTIANYISSLANMGVAGFRIDAAKHINPNDLTAIVAKVNGGLNAGVPMPYIYQEVIDKGGEAIHASDYFNVGGSYTNANVHEFKYGINLASKFRNTGGKLADLKTFGESWGLMPSYKAVAFVDNHDEQRTGTANYMTYKDSGNLYMLGNVFMLAWPYGYPQIMSSYAFSDNNQGPPSDSNGNTNTIYSNGTPNCFGAWVCEHRWRQIGNMVGFRNYTNAVFSTSDWWDNGNNEIAFGRGANGFVVINREDNTSLSRTFQTSMADGVYCDILHGDFNSSNSTCSGPTVTVSSHQANISVSSHDAVAIHIGAKVGTSGSTTASITFNATVSQTVTGQEVYVVGNIPALGNWNTSAGIHLTTNSNTFPVWTVTASLPASTAVQYKYIIKDAAGNVTWENGSNRTFTTPAGGGSLTLNDTWHT
jgi:alpha-amylase